MEFDKITQTYRPRMLLVASISVARVQPRTSKGITAVNVIGSRRPPGLYLKPR